MRYKRDTRKKRFIAVLEAQGTVSTLAELPEFLARPSYRWRDDDPKFAILWDEAHEQAVDAVESVLFQKGVERRHYLHDLLPQGAPSDLSRQTEHRFNN
jgi:hypothetical protein